MRSLYALCYPTLNADDRRFIDELRREHDVAFRDVVAPHVTLLFGCGAVKYEVYNEHVRTTCEGQSRIAFSCRYAMVCNDAESDHYYAFLVPDQGFAAISQLHDRLYRGVMAPHLRLDIPFVPHIAVATDNDAARIKALCDLLNADGIAIEGRLDAVTVCEYDGAKITDLETLPFAAA